MYAYTGARLASGAITFEQVGPELPAKVVELSYQKAKATKGEVKGNIPILDIQYGNVSVALNMDNFAQKHQVTSGADWNIDVKKCAK